MFVIRQRHVAALEAARLDDFCRRAARDLSARFEPAARAEPAALEAFVRAGIDDARRYGLLSETDVLVLLEYRMLCGDAFPEGPDDAWAKAILDNPRLDVGEKLRQLDASFVRLSLIDDAHEEAVP